MATLQLILHQRSDRNLNRATDLMTKLARAEAQKEYGDLSRYLDDKTSPERKAILAVLNQHEFVAVGINKGIIDEESYKRAYYNIVIRDWDYLENTINAIRKSPTGSSTNFQEFQLLAECWKKNPLKQY